MATLSYSTEGARPTNLLVWLVGRGIQVVTNSLPVANLFTRTGDHDLVFVGGYVHLRTGVSLGRYANDMIRQLNVGRSVLSVAAISPRGYFNSHLLLVETERAMMEAADEVTVVADSTKFGRQSLAHLCDLGAVDSLVVDSHLDTSWRERLAQAGVQVVIASEPEKQPTDTTKRPGTDCST